MSSDFPPSIAAGKLVERVSVKGKRYLVGYLGPVRLIAFASAETDEQGRPTWDLKIAEAPPRDKAKGPPSEVLRSSGIAKSAGIDSGDIPF